MAARLGNLHVIDSLQLAFHIQSGLEMVLINKNCSINQSSMFAYETPQGIMFTTGASKSARIKRSTNITSNTNQEQGIITSVELDGKL